jgi:hypothetical protein
MRSNHWSGSSLSANSKMHCLRTQRSSSIVGGSIIRTQAMWRWRLRMRAVLKNSLCSDLKLSSAKLSSTSLGTRTSTLSRSSRRLIYAIQKLRRKRKRLRSPMRYRRLKLKNFKSGLSRFKIKPGIITKFQLRIRSCTVIHLMTRLKFDYQN